MMPLVSRDHVLSSPVRVDEREEEEEEEDALLRDARGAGKEKVDWEMREGLPGAVDDRTLSRRDQICVG